MGRTIILHTQSSQLLLDKAVSVKSTSIVLFLPHSVYNFAEQIVFIYNGSHERTVSRMREKKNHIYVDSQERTLLLHSLVELKNQLIQQGRYTDCIDEIIFKVVNAPVRRIKIEYV